MRVYKGRKLLDEMRGKKIKKKEIKTRTVRRKRERTMCILA